MCKSWRKQVDTVISGITALKLIFGWIVMC